MVITEFYRTRQDGVRLFRTYSDQGFILVRNDDAEFNEAVDVEGNGYTYTERDNLAEPMTETKEKALAYDIITGGRMNYLE